MKLLSAHLVNFKSLGNLQIDFKNATGAARQLTCLLGDNGAGKTTALQAIALVLSLATRRTRFADQFDWHGFLAERIGSRGRTRIELEVQLSDSEIQLTTSLFRQWYDSLSTDWRETHQIIAPSEEQVVTLVYEQNHLSSPGGYQAVNQFLGRYYVKILAKMDPLLRRHFAELGDVFWFDQHRNLGSASARRYSSNESSEDTRENWQAGVEQLRQYLLGWWGYHTSPNRGNGKDYIPELEQHFGCVFPGHRFVGLTPIDGESSLGAADFYFLLQSEDRVYDLAEMSSGEQAVFPLIYEFVRLDIRNSVVLIDELELHLHPPEQQRLLAALPQLGRDCQFVISTHSPYLVDAIPNDQEVRLEGGQRCL